MKEWRLLLHPDLPGYRQMAIDESLYLSALDLKAPAIRMYTWSRPTLSLGYFQDYKRVVCEPFCVHNNIHVVRRMTGGRAVLHHLEMTYSITAPLDRGVFKNFSLQDTYRFIARGLDLALTNLGVEHASVSLKNGEGSQEQKMGRAQCFVSLSRYELGAKERKIIGSAQKRSPDRFLQHGSILLDFDRELQQGCVNNPDPEIEEKIAPLRSILGRTPEFNELNKSFATAFGQAFGVTIVESDLEPQERALAEDLELKYQSDDWTRRECK